MQSNWIGKSIGAEINFIVHNSESISSNFIKVFTTRPETIFGASFCALSLDHNISKEIAKNDKELKKFISDCSLLNSEKEKIGFKMC